MASTSFSVCVRDKSKIYLVGHPSHQIAGSKLPSNGQVLKSLFYNIRQVGLTVREAATLTLSEVTIFWEKARIPTQLQKHAISKIEKLHDEWKNIQKSSSRKSKTQEGKELAFKSKLNDLFDIAAGDVLSKMTNPEDIQFLTLQRQKGRPGCMGGVDIKYAQAEERRSARKAREEARREEQRKADTKKTGKAEIELLTSPETEEEAMETLDSDSDSVFLMELGNEPDNDASTSVTKKRKRSRGSNQVVTEKLGMLLDRCNISDRNAMRILFATAEALGLNTDELVLSRSTIRDRRILFREQRANKVKAKFQNKNLEGAIVHWDGKLLPNIKKENVERLAILVSSGEEEQLLGVPALENSTGSSQSEAVAESLKDWGLTDKVIGMCFDTTASNTGRVKGACTLLEKQLGKDLLYLACRHHMLEVVLKAVFDCKMGSTTGPQPDIFKRFQTSWAGIDQSKYKLGIEDKKVEDTLRKYGNNVTTFLQSQLHKCQPRDDYRELLHLCLIFMGKMPPDNVKFRSPGAYSHARWMAKAIYAIKIFIFREEFPLTEKELESLRDINLFIVILYAKMWFLAPNAVTAPNADFNFIRDAWEYKSTDRITSEKILQKYLNHLWYLNPEQVCFSLFDETVSEEVKRRIALRILSYQREENQPDEIFQRIVRVKITNLEVEDFIQNRELDYFITGQSLCFFEKFNITLNFLHQDPSTWHENEEYLQCFGLVTHLKVVNDTAERGVKLIEDFNQSLTHDEEQKQFVLQVVSECRQLYPDTSRATLSKLY